VIATATFLALALLPQRARAEVRCDYSQRIECTAAGCRAAAATGGFLRLASASSLIAATAAAKDAASLPTIQVCDATTCTPIAVRAAASGVFVNIAQDGGAHFVKVAMRDVPPGIRTGDFIEVAAQFLSTVTHVGSCPAAAR
jgi:hypothetical protein